MDIHYPIHGFSLWLGVCGPDCAFLLSNYNTTIISKIKLTSYFFSISKFFINFIYKNYHECSTYHISMQFSLHISISLSLSWYHLSILTPNKKTLLENFEHNIYNKPIIECCALFWNGGVFRIHILILVNFLKKFIYILNYTLLLILT